MTPTPALRTKSTQEVPLMMVGDGICQQGENCEIVQHPNGMEGGKDVEGINSGFSLVKKGTGSHRETPVVMNSLDRRSPKEMPYDALVRATNNFSEEMVLGKGGFGPVYRGFLSDVGLDVAVKKLSERSEQGIAEYMSEVKIISQLRHRNLVKIIGWCHEHGELLLVYEFMPNGSLDLHLFKGKSFLSWPVRYKIACGLANALMYLHDECDPCVLHRDLKSSNVLLNSKFDAKLADFGLARPFDTDISSLLVSCPAGTRGYWAPEYALRCRASRRSDVYSYGVVALEIACGKKAIHMMEGEDGESSPMLLVEWVWELYGKGAILDAADGRLKGNFDRRQMGRLLTVGLWCAHPDHRRRPTARQASNALLYPETTPLPALPRKTPLWEVSLFEPTKSNRSMPAMVSWFTGWRRKGKQSPPCQTLDDDANPAMVTVPREFSYSDLLRATKRFSWDRIIGMGAFGKVYKGMLPSGEAVAVKWFCEDGIRTGEEYFLTEMATLRCLTHQNLVKLLGWCCEGGHRLLVYEYMANGSLDRHLFSGPGSRVLPWDARYGVALGLASAVCYLHTLGQRCVLHRDIHSQNVLLDEGFHAKLGGFALARQAEQDSSLPTTVVRSTCGHLAPEFCKTGKYTKECDVYLFGMLALQIASGRRTVQPSAISGRDCVHILSWVWSHYGGDGEIVKAADPKLEGDFDEEEMVKLVVVGLWCTHHDPAQRPPMAKVLKVLQLEEELPSLFV